MTIYDTSSGVNVILNKLPYRLQQKWLDRAAKYKRTYNVPYPPLTELIKYLQEMCMQCNDPVLVIQEQSNKVQMQTFSRQKPISVAKIEVEQRFSCILHGSSHPLKVCHAFQQKPLDERKILLKEKNVCYRCCESNSHMFRQCKASIKCNKCGSVNHPTPLHIDRDIPASHAAHGGEKMHEEKGVSSKCTAICGEGYSGRSYAKTMLVRVYPAGHPESSVLTYAVRDDQSNKTLGSTALFDTLNMAVGTKQFILRSCSGASRITSRQATNLVVEALDRTCTLILSSLIECNIPGERSDIPTPEIARHFKHLSHLADCIPALEPDVEVGLLIGRDNVEAHHVEQQIIGPKNTPFAQKLPLGWAITGEVCLGQRHQPDTIGVLKTYIAKGPRLTILNPCDKQMEVKEETIHRTLDGITNNVFITSTDDDNFGLSQDDCDFLEIMDSKMTKGVEGRCKAPLPFKKERPTFDNNHSQALKRAHILVNSLEKKSKKQQHMIEFMDQIFDSQAAEVAPPIHPNAERWYLPLFGVYHPRKPDKIRGVFDSSVEWKVSE